MPPIDSGLKQRKEYQTLNASDIVPTQDNTGTEESFTLTAERNAVDHDVNARWWPLIWSFTASSMLTVAAHPDPDSYVEI
jgi:hypothetical protein